MGVDRLSLDSVPTRAVTSALSCSTYGNVFVAQGPP